ncbi:MAG: nuclear transport factor 2 family protein [Pyrinomonadaceae bacterium]
MRRITLRLALALITFILGISATSGFGFLSSRFASDKSDKAARSSEREPELITTATSPQIDEQEILEILRQYGEAQTQHDEAFFERTEADDFILTVEGRKTLTRAEDIAEMKSWKMDTRFSNDDMHVQFYGDAAIVTGRMTATPFDKEDGYSTHWQWVHLFVKRDGRWRIIYSHYV